VAMINDFDSRWAIDFQRHNQEFDPVAEIVAFYRPLREAAQGVDIIGLDAGGPDASLAKYKLIVAPGLNVLTQPQADKLLAYVRAGGHLLLGPRSGMKNVDDGLNPQQQPGPLADALGAKVTQFYALDQPVPLTMGDTSGSANIWAETLETSSPETKTIATYGASNGWLDGQPAAVTRQVGQGSITYLGAWLDDASLKKLTDQLLNESGAKPMIPGVPDNVEVCVRTGGGRTVVILINHGSEQSSLTLPASLNAKSLLDGAVLSGGSVILPKYGVVVLQTAKLE
jgi:beta-galactosidase